MLTWPHEGSGWGLGLEAVEQVFLRLAQELARRERLLIACHDDALLRRVRARLRAAGVLPERCALHAVPSNDCWARDHGPITVYQGGRPLLLDFTFNGWGGKYPAELDQRVTQGLHQLGAFGDAPVLHVPLVLEGGAIDTDGAGTLLTTRRCLLSAARNPDLDRSAWERRLGDYLGIERVLWLEHGGLEGDDTDSHIDTLARFCDAQTIAYVRCDDPDDTHYPDLARMREEIEAWRMPNGQPYRLLPLPWPRAVHNAQGRRLPATYANFLIINQAVLLPCYDDPADAQALRQLRSVFPDREVVGIPCLPLVHQYGSLHCVTMQLPAGVLAGGDSRIATT